MAAALHETSQIKPQPSEQDEIPSLNLDTVMNRRQLISNGSALVLGGAGATILGPILFIRAQGRIEKAEDYIYGSTPAKSPSLDVFREDQRKALQEAKIDNRNAKIITAIGPVAIATGTIIKIRERRKERILTMQEISNRADIYPNE